ncbi:MAG: cation:proton antiporter [Candidatus Diapherotrites archaeon]|nr:cation:proton antiporter [Candidatus Diapherotrites archaeon]
MNTEVLLVIALLIAFVLSEACKHLKIPRVIGQVGTGIFLGATFFREWFTPLVSADFSLLAGMGLVLMFFFVGLQINLRDLKNNAVAGAIISLFKTPLPILGAVFILPLVGFDFNTSLIIGIALSVSSQAVALDFLDELGMLKSRLGKLVVTAGAVDDVFGFAIISLALSYIHLTVNPSTPFQIAGGFIAFVLILILCRYTVIPFLLKLFEEEKSNTHLFMGSMVLLFLMVVLGDYFGIGALIGAFTGGMLVRHTLLSADHHRPWEEHKIAKQIQVVSFGFFVPIFFIWVGFNTNIGAVLSDPAFTVIAVSIAFIGTIGGTTLGAVLAKHTPLEGFTAGWGLNAKGDTELAIATAALQAGAITASIYSGLIVMSVFATLVSPIVFRFLVQRHAVGEEMGKIGLIHGSTRAI